MLSDIALERKGQLESLTAVAPPEWSLAGKATRCSSMAAGRTMTARAGAATWRVVNAAKSRHFQIHLGGPRFTTIGGDGGLLEHPVDERDADPGGRRARRRDRHARRRGRSRARRRDRFPTTADMGASSTDEQRAVHDRHRRGPPYTLRRPHRSGAAIEPSSRGRDTSRRRLHARRRGDGVQGRHRRRAVREGEGR